MKYKYFISYSHSRGFGASEFYRDCPISDYGDLKAIAKIIEQENDVRSVVVINFRRFENEE